MVIQDIKNGSKNFVKELKDRSRKRIRPKFFKILGWIMVVIGAGGASIVTVNPLIGAIMLSAGGMGAAISAITVDFEKEKEGNNE